MSDNTGSIVITGQANIEFARLLTLASGLSLEISTGMKMSNRYNAMQLANSASGSNKRTKKGALRDLVKHMSTLRPDYTPSDRVKAAMV